MRVRHLGRHSSRRGLQDWVLFQARASADQEHYLINPFGLMYNEVTASSLVKVDKEGNIVDGGSTCLGVNKAGLVLHSAIHGARKDIKCVIHLHQHAAVAVCIPSTLTKFFVFARELPPFFLLCLFGTCKRRSAERRILKLARS